MIAELVENVSHRVREYGNGEQRILFPEPAINVGDHQGQEKGKTEERTFAVNPQ